MYHNYDGTVVEAASMGSPQASAIFCFGQVPPPCGAWANAGLRGSHDKAAHIQVQEIHIHPGLCPRQSFCPTEARMKLRLSLV